MAATATFKGFLVGQMRSLSRHALATTDLIT